MLSFSSWFRELKLYLSNVSFNSPIVYWSNFSIILLRLFLSSGLSNWKPLIKYLQSVYSYAVKKQCYLVFRWLRAKFRNDHTIVHQLFPNFPVFCHVFCWSHIQFSWRQDARSHHVSRNTWTCHYQRRLLCCSAWRISLCVWHLESGLLKGLGGKCGAGYRVPGYGVLGTRVRGVENAGSGGKCGVPFFWPKYEFSSLKWEAKILLAYIAMNINSASRPEMRCLIKRAN